MGKRAGDGGGLVAVFTVRPFTQIPPGEWNDLVKASPDGWVWGLAEWRSLILDVDAWGLEDWSFGLYVSDDLVGVMPLQYQAAASKMASSGWGLVGPIVKSGVTRTERPQIWRELLRHAEALGRERGAKQIELGAAPLTRASRETPWGVNPFVAFGYEDLSTHTRIVDLTQGEGALWSAFSENAKRKIKRAQKLGCTVKQVDWGEAIDRYYEAHCATYTRTGVTPHPRRYFEGIAQHLAPLGHSVLWAGCDADGKMVAFRNDARLAEGVLYHTGCSVDEALDTGVNYLLVWEAMRGAIRDGYASYEVGEVFPAAREGKAKSLTDFKSRFGGDLRRYFKARKSLERPEEAPRDLVTDAVRPVADREDQAVRDAYERGSLYAPSRICLRPKSGVDDYVDRLLEDKLETAASMNNGGRVVDLCCGAGAHLLAFAPIASRAIGIDFTERYLVEGRREATAKQLTNTAFLRADARQLPLSTGSVDLLYCFSALYAIPRAEQIIAEVGRVLAPQGKAVLDFGNRRSLNTFCLRYYTDWPPVYPLSLSEISLALEAANLRIIRHRRFQLLPLWAGRPRWLMPLLHPVWKQVLKRRVRGRMLDEWISALPVLRAFAFRHLIVCEKTT